jgi:hypothetical protein
MQAGFLDARGGVWRFDIDEYEHYEQVGGIFAWHSVLECRFRRSLAHRRPTSVTWPAVDRSILGSDRLDRPPKVENGDLNWVVPGKLLAFSGPAARPTEFVGFRSPVPEDYTAYFRRRRVAAVVRLNKKVRACGSGFGRLHPAAGAAASATRSRPARPRRCLLQRPPAAHPFASSSSSARSCRTGPAAPDRPRTLGAKTPAPAQAYDRRRFTDDGLCHHDLYFPDGSNPPTDLLLRFLEVAEQVGYRDWRGRAALAAGCPPSVLGSENGWGWER